MTAEHYDMFAHPRAFREALAVHQAFGRLGFSLTEHVFVHFYEREPYALTVVLRYDGREFAVACGNEGICGWSYERFAKRWTEFATRQREAPEEQFERLWEESWIYAHAAEFAVALQLKGIHWPNLDADLGDPASRPTIDPLVIVH